MRRRISGRVLADAGGEDETVDPAQDGGQRPISLAARYTK